MVGKKPGSRRAFFQPLRLGFRLTCHAETVPRIVNSGLDYDTICRQGVADSYLAGNSSLHAIFNPLAGIYLPPYSPIAPTTFNRHFRRTSRLNAHHFAVAYVQIVLSGSFKYRPIFEAAYQCFVCFSLGFQSILIEAVRHSILPGPAKTSCSYSVVDPPQRKVKNASKWKPIGAVGSVCVPD